ncbi:MAG TPA: TolC family protein [Thermoanaerobaculia bacterium]|jgi:HAE1 family hydrophobic/amphiphilic exporter-1
MRRFVSILVWLTAAMGAAQEAGNLSLSLADASQRALSHNTDLFVERENLAQAGFTVWGAEGAYDLFAATDVSYRDHTDPVNSLFSGAPDGILAPDAKGVSVSGTFTQLIPTGGTAQFFGNWQRDTTNNVFVPLSPAYSTGFGVSLRQPLLRGLWIDPAREAIRVASARQGQSEARLRRVVSNVITQVDAAYWNLVAARRNVASIASSVELAGQQLSETKSRVEAGVLGETDIAQPTAEQERRRGLLASARQLVTQTQNELKRLIIGDQSDPDWGKEIVPTDEPEANYEAPPLADMLSVAQQKRPEVGEATAQRTVAEVEVEARKADKLPRLDLVASYARRGLAGSINPDAESFNGGPITVPPPLLGGTGRSYGTIGENRFPDASIGLSVSVPITNRTARANYAIASSQLQQAKVDLTATRQQVEAEVRDAAAALETARTRIDSSKAARVAAETQLFAEQEKFNVGLSTNFLVLTRQNDLTQARVTETDALTDYRKSATELMRATGTLLERRQITLDTPDTSHGPVGRR